jgi:hypothetical protein
MDDPKSDRGSDLFTYDFLSKYAQALRDNRTKWFPLAADPTSKLEYHVFADAVYWDDEFPRPIDADLENAFRMVINHRTSLLCGDVGRFPEVWALAKECYPQWPGFLPERCTANVELANRIRRIRRVSVWRMDRIEKEAENS